MKKTLLSLCFGLFAVLSFAQIGITAGYTSLEAPEWEFEFQQEFGTENQLLANGNRVGINYWLRLKKVRLEFFPSIEYANYGSQIGNSSSVSQFNYSARFVGGFLHTRVYLFDFINDCNCPTFSKQNETFKKGFFVQLSPGYEFFQTEVKTRTEDNVLTRNNNDSKLSLGASIGLDIGVSDFMTLTPIVGASYLSEVDGDHLMNDKVLGDDFSNIYQFFAGINVGLRFERSRRY
ncbi:MAG: hypothetical protein AAFO82_22165, partial [Bacteroidota bacterium]